MKKLLLVLVSLVLMSGTAYADFAKMRVKISDPVGDNRYFLCVGTTSCVSIKAGDKGQVYPMDAGKIEDIYATDVTTLRMYAQNIPASCKVTVSDNETVTVTGRLVREGNKVALTDLNCHVA